ncbi:hypothetical protein ACJJTC_011901 [Scirpophaga incertulas]
MNSAKRVADRDVFLKINIITVVYLATPTNCSNPITGLHLRLAALKKLWIKFDPMPLGRTLWVYLSAVNYLRGRGDAAISLQVVDPGYNRFRLVLQRRRAEGFISILLNNNVSIAKGDYWFPGLLSGDHLYYNAGQRQARPNYGNQSSVLFSLMQSNSPV